MRLSSSRRPSVPSRRRRPVPTEEWIIEQPPDSGFFVVISRVPLTSPAAAQTAQPPWRRHELRGQAVRVLTFQDVEVASDETRGLTAYLHGQLYDEVSLERLVARHAANEEALLEACNGSFALLLVDEPKGRVVLATDRLSSKPLYLRGDPEAWYVSSKLRHLVTEASRLDRTGLAWYLSCGVVFTDRTLLAGVSRVPRASCCTFTGDGRREVRSYWAYEFSRDRAGQSPERQRAELVDILIECVRTRSRPESRQVVSLSAGYDSRGVFGILTDKLHHSVESFSYGLHEGIEGSDADVARRIAEGHGSSHRFVASYDGDLQDAIERNARWGDGGTNFCDEALAWGSLAARFRGERLPLFVGDTVFVENWEGERDVYDQAYDYGVRGFSGLKWLEDLLPGQLYRELHDGQETDLSEFLRVASGVGSLMDSAYFINVDQYLPHVILPWRECYASRPFAVQDALLDNRLLDFVRTLDDASRWNKRIYVECAASLLPDLFAVPRASVGGYATDWTAELRREAVALAKASRPRQASAASLLDDVIDPGIVRRVCGLDEMAGVGRPAQPVPVSLLRTMRRKRRNLLRRLGRKPPVERVSPAEFLLRYLVLRRFLEIAAQDSVLARLRGPDGLE
jgi:hypothetical protein